MTAKKESKKQKDELPEGKIIYPTAEDVVRINRAVLGKLPPEELEKLPESTRKEIERMNKQLKPRPKERIPEILDALRELWLQTPDQRLGQLLLNSIFHNVDHGDRTSVEMYAQEDTVTARNIKRQVKKSKRGTI